jgi:hypothetical protein
MASGTLSDALRRLYGFRFKPRAGSNKDGPGEKQKPAYRGRSLLQCSVRDWTSISGAMIGAGSFE